MSRTVCHFSCGAASAVATKLVLSEADPAAVVILNAFLEEEHPDNRRFAADCERWFGYPITVLRNEKYSGSAREVWRRKRFIVSGVYGPACSSILKHELMDALAEPGDVHIVGFTSEEAGRFERMAQRRAMAIRAPLIERNLSKADCLAIIERAGIRLPAMYELGFNNANCIGCPQGGEGYWNHVRRTFPDRFTEMIQIQEELGPGAYFFRDRHSGERFGLKSLSPTAGRHDEPMPSCSFFCAMAEQEIDDKRGL
jgi:3'-phosphoadenosine 5'-phosphosulfate sulfotransferase (PAPS reductase)/FAD synthetase